MLELLPALIVKRPGLFDSVDELPARLKSFRFTPADQRLLEQLAKTLGISGTEVVRRALRALL